MAVYAPAQAPTGKPDARAEVLYPRLERLRSATNDKRGIDPRKVRAMATEPKPTRTVIYQGNVVGEYDCCVCGTATPEDGFVAVEIPHPVKSIVCYDCAAEIVELFR